jgi:ATP-binding cassette, subfamily B, bacterial
MKPPDTPSYDLKNALHPNRLVGLWRIMTGYHLPYLGAIASQGGAALMKTSTFLLLRYFVDQVLGQPAMNSMLPVVALGFVAMACLEGSFTYVSGRLAAYTAEGMTRRLRNYLFDHIQRLSFAYHSKAKTGDLIERSTSDVDAVRRFFSEQAIGVGRIFMLFTINFIALLQLNTFLAWISVIAIPFIFITSILFFRRLTKVYEEYQQQEAVLSTTLQENLTGVRVVKAFARQQYEIDKFEKENWEKFVRGRRLMLMHSAFWPVSDIICAAQMLFGFTVAALMAINGQITIGTYLAYAGLVVWLIFPMRNLGRLIVQTSTGMVSFGRVTDIIREDREPLEQGDYLPDGRLPGHIVFDDVCFEYAGSDGHVLQNVSFECQPGQSVALLGPTGSGKTTLVNLLPRFYEYTCGQVLVDGVALNRYPRKYLRSQIGIVEQEPFLFSRSIRENISYGIGRRVADEEIVAAAKAAAIHDVILSFPEGYGTLVGEKGVTLSGGQKQRVAIARALLKNPRILILDDSTSSVDTETEAEIRGALETLMKDRTTFIIAHRIQSVMDADLILVLDKGHVVQKGTHAELVTQEDGIYRRIYDIQTRIETELATEIGKASGGDDHGGAEQDELPPAGLPTGPVPVVTSPADAHCAEQTERLPLAGD